MMTWIKGFVLAAALGLIGAHSPALAQSAPRGISVQQVMEAIENAPNNDHARQVLTAYLSGIGETTGALFRDARYSELASSDCTKAVSLSWDGVAKALVAAAPDTSQWSAIPATPIIVTSMLDSAQCR